MMTMRKAIGVLLSLLLVLCLLPATAMAKENGLDITAKGACEELAANGGSAVLSGSTLTISGIRYTSSAAQALWLPDNTVLVLEGTNVIESAYNGTGNTIGICCASGLIIKGSGSLKVVGGTSTDGNSYGIMTERGAVNIHGGSVSAVGGKAAGSSYGICSTKGSIKITAGTVNANGGTCGAYQDSCGICANEGDISISGGTVTAVGGSVSGLSTGLWAYQGDVTIAGGTVNATGSRGDVASRGIYAEEGTVELNGGTLLAVGGASADSFGIQGKSVDVNSGAKATAKGAVYGIKGGVTIYGAPATTALVAVTTGSGKALSRAAKLEDSDPVAVGAASVDGSGAVKYASLDNSDYAYFRYGTADAGNVAVASAAAADSGAVVTAPPTGDMGVGLYVVLAGIAGAAAAVLVVLKRKRA